MSTRAEQEREGQHRQPGNCQGMMPRGPGVFFAKQKRPLCSGAGVDEQCGRWQAGAGTSLSLTPGCNVHPADCDKSFVHLLRSQEVGGGRPTPHPCFLHQTFFLSSRGSFNFFYHFWWSGQEGRLNECTECTFTFGEEPCSCAKSLHMIVQLTQERARVTQNRLQSPIRPTRLSKARFETTL